MTTPTDIIDQLLEEATKLDEPASQPNQSLPFTLYSAADALKPQPPIDWVIERLFCAGSVNLVTGEPGAKKTWAMLDCAVAVATGQAWLSFRTRQSPVLWIDEESGRNRMFQRLGMTLRGWGAGPETPIWFTSLAGFNLHGDSLQQTLDQLQLLIRGANARFVVADALVDLLRGGDENAVKDVQPAFHGLRCIADETQSAVVLIHHSGKGGNSYRGSSAIHGAVDLLLKVESQENSDIIKFSVEKARDVERHNFAAKANFMTDMFNLTSADLIPPKPHFSKSEQYAYDFMSRNGPSAMDEIISHADVCSANSARHAVYSLIQRGFAKRFDSGGPGVKATYGLCQPEDVLDADLGF